LGLSYQAFQQPFHWEKVLIPTHQGKMLWKDQKSDCNIFFPTWKDFFNLLFYRYETLHYVWISHWRASW